MHNIIMVLSKWWTMDILNKWTVNQSLKQIKSIFFLDEVSNNILREKSHVVDYFFYIKHVFVRATHYIAYFSFVDNLRYKKYIVLN